MGIKIGVAFKLRTMRIILTTKKPNPMPNLGRHSCHNAFKKLQFENNLCEEPGGDPQRKVGVWNGTGGTLLLRNEMKRLR